MAPVTYERASRCQPGSEKPAVDALDLQITQGEFLLLVGPGTLSENIVTPVDPGRPSAKGERVHLRRQRGKEHLFRVDQTAAPYLTS